MANVLAVSFAGVLVATDPGNPEPFQRSPDRLSLVRFPKAAVETALLSLDPSSAMGPDGIHPLLLKECAKELSLPLSFIFEQSFRSGVVPECWSQSEVVPIFKAKSHCDPLNYDQ